MSNQATESENPVSEYIDVICRVAVKLTHDKEKAASLVADTLEAASLLSPDEIKAICHIKSWLLTKLRKIFLKKYQEPRSRAA